MVSILKVDKLDPQSGTALEIGTSGDTVTVPTGAGLTVTDEVKTNKVSPATGTAFALGDSGDTFTVPSGATLDISASTLTPPATMPASSGINFTALNATNLGSGTVPTARLGTGTASSTTILYGDQTYKTEPAAGGQYKVVSTTYDCSTTGALAITGAGFEPKFLWLQYDNGDWVAGRMGWGFSDGTSDISMNDGNQQTSDSWKSTAGKVQDQIFSSSNYSYLAVASFDADGCTLTKTKYGSPTGTITLDIAFFG